MRPFKEKEEDRLLYSELKEWTSDQSIDEKLKTIPGSGMRIYKDSEAGRIERGNPGVKGGDADYGQNRDGSIRKQPKASEQLKIGESKWSQLDTAGKVAAGGQILSQALNTIGMFTGDQDEIVSMGSGHQPIGYDPRMHIGRTV
tara:strand:- start:1908 stop:2339 length:432 start_codon:yes stop_codon:yes gene_type:complete